MQALIPLFTVLTAAFPAASGWPPTVGAGTDTILHVTWAEPGTPRLGRNAFHATVRNLGDERVLAVLDLRAVPGMWMIPNTQRQFSAELDPGEEGVLEGTYEFRRMSREATLHARLGPGERSEEGHPRLLEVEYERTWDVGRMSPDAYDPSSDFDTLRQGPLELYAWRGSLAARTLQEIASERLAAMQSIQNLLGVSGSTGVRMVFYADERTKLEQTGHQGIGWATGHTIVEVLNDSVRLDPFHELAHIVADEVGTPPAALGEGFAIYATEHLGSDALLYLGHPGQSANDVTCRAQRDGDLIPLLDLLATRNIGSDESRSGLEYAEAGSLVRFIAERWGVARFREAYAILSDGAEASENLGRLASILDISPAAVEAEWIDAAAAECDPPFSPLPTLGIEDQAQAPLGDEWERRTTPVPPEAGGSPTQPRMAQLYCKLGYKISRDLRRYDSRHPSRDAGARPAFESCGGTRGPPSGRDGD